MLKKFTNKKGFTLMEMLIVVAIIAVLIAIAIPTFASQLNKAKESTDLANIRAGYAAAQIEALTVDSATERVLYLQPDGSVNKEKTNAYKCKGKSTDAELNTSFGGLTTPAATTWDKDQVIKYTIAAGTNKVASIAAE